MLGQSLVDILARLVASLLILRSKLPGFRHRAEGVGHARRPALLRCRVLAFVDHATDRAATVADVRQGEAFAGRMVADRSDGFGLRLAVVGVADDPDLGTG